MINAEQPATAPLLKYTKELRSAVEEWEAMGAPLPKNYGEASAKNVRAIASGEMPEGSPLEALRLVLHFIEQEQIAVINRRSTERIQAKIAAQREQRDKVVMEMKAIREALGLTLAEMNTELGLPNGVIANAERFIGTYGIDSLEQLLARYRTKAKVAGKEVSQ